MTKDKKIPKIQNSEIVFQESLVKIQKDTLLLDDQYPFPYYILKTKPFAVAVLATTPDHLYILTKEYRYPAQQYLLSCPGGYMELNENPLECARRELLEETGYEAEHFELIGSAYPYAGFSTQKTFYIKATGAIKKSNLSLEASEVIETILLTRENLKEFKLKNNLEFDANLCTALFLEFF